MGVNGKTNVKVTVTTHVLHQESIVQAFRVENAKNLTRVAKPAWRGTRVEARGFRYLRDGCKGWVGGWWVEFFELGL